MGLPSSVLVSQTPQQVTGKKQARLFTSVQLRFCTVACFLCLACVLCAPLPSTMLHATRQPKTKRSIPAGHVHVQCIGPRSRNRTCFGFWTRNRKAIEIAPATVVLAPPFQKTYAIQDLWPCSPIGFNFVDHHGVCIGYWLWRGNCVSTTCCTRDGDLRRLVASDLQDASRLSRLWKQFFQRTAKRTLFVKASCTTDCSSELVPLTNACNCFVVTA